MALQRQFSWLLVFIAVLWCGLVVTDYWFKHPLYEKALSSPSWGVVLVHLLLIGLTVGALVKRANNRWRVLLSIAGMFYLMVTLSFTVSAMIRMESGVSWFDAVGLWSSVLVYGLFILCILGSAYVLGQAINQSLGVFQRIGHSLSFSLVLGLSVFMVVNMTFLATGLYHSMILWACVLGPIAWGGYRLQDERTRRSLMEWGSESNFEGLGIFEAISVALILVFTSMCYVHCLSPMPVGFDAMNYYINIPRLISQEGGLIRGFQPHYWSLIQAMGIKMTGWNTMALQLSWLGLPLLQLGMYELGRRVLRMERAWTLFAVLMMTCMPTVLTQASQELKVDLPFTFVMISLVSAILGYLSRMDNKSELGKSELLVLFLIGMMGGIGLGIKLTAVLVIVGLLVMMWSRIVSVVSGFGVALLALGAFLVMGLDGLSGMRVYHASNAWLPYVLILTGCGTLGYGFMKNLASSVRSMKMSAAVVVGMILLFSPWMIKNASEVNRLTPMKLLRGQPASKQLEMKKIDKVMKPLMK